MVTTLRPPRSGGFVLHLLLVWLLFGVVSVQAATPPPLKVSTDRTELHQNETLRMTVIGDMKLELSFDNLFSLGNLNLPTPDLGDLETRFQVLGVHQSYNVQSVNGDHRATVTWTYQLAPLASGTLEIPALTFNESRSEPIRINVLPGNKADTQPDSPGNHPGGNRDAYVKASLSAEQVYVQEPLVLTVQLVFTPPLLRGELEQPELPDVIMEPLGKQQDYTRMENGEPRQVVERRYVLYPQRSGELEVPGLAFRGRQRDAYGNLRFLEAASDPVRVQVKPVPASFSGKVWLPSPQLSIREDWSREPSQLQVGDSLNRTLQVQAKGLLAATLPPFDVPYRAPLKGYAEPAKLDNAQHQDGIDGTRTERTALVVTEAGEVTLPEIRIPWWDTQADVERVAILPARTLRIGGSTATPPAASPTDAAGVDATTPTSSTITDNGPWPFVAGVLAFAWLATLGMWWRSRQPAPTTPPAPRSVPPISDATLQAALRTPDPKAFETLLRWCEHNLPSPRHSRWRSLDDLRQHLDDAELSRLLTELEGYFYAPQAGNWPGEALYARLLARRANGHEPVERSAVIHGAPFTPDTPSR
ncbi:MAG: BatD family protein [Gammaproteobacteria bacterium]|nr:BatD family protein [Gammaproteobacteria bacterium]